MLPKKSQLLIFCLLSASVSAANDPKPPEKLPLGTVLDSQGNPIKLPTTIESSLEFKTAQPKAMKSPLQQKSNNKSKNILNRKKQLTRQAKVANDPNCRWLAQRIKQLKKHKSSTKGYQNQELTIREKEWKCMKCSAEGPKQEDYARCQHRR